MSDAIQTEEELNRKDTWLKAILGSAAEISRLGRAVRIHSNVAKANLDLLHDAELLKLDLRDAQRQRVEAFRSAVSNLLTLVNNYLDLSHIESGQFELENIGFDLKNLLERMLERMFSVADTRKLVLKLNFVAGIPKILGGDPARLQQVLNVLLNTALKVAEAGEIRLTAQASATNPHRVSFSLNFCTAQHGLEQERQEGVGVCQILLHQMGSELKWRNHPGPEGHVTFDLMFAPVLSPAITNGPGEVDKPQVNIRILIAEDSADSRFLLQEFLKREPYDLTFAENGKLALEAALGHTFDLILMDIQMPVMDGLTATRLIREAEDRQGRPTTPLLALTAHTRKADIDLSLAAGCNAHISKPISKSGLLETIRKYSPPFPSQEKLHVSIPSTCYSAS